MSYICSQAITVVEDLKHLLKDETTSYRLIDFDDQMFKSNSITSSKSIFIRSKSTSQKMSIYVKSSGIMNATSEKYFMNLQPSILSLQKISRCSKSVIMNSSITNNVEKLSQGNCKSLSWRRTEPSMNYQ